MRRSKKISTLRVTGLGEGNPPVTGGFLSQRSSNAENVSIWWRHHSLPEGLWPQLWGPKKDVISDQSLGTCTENLVLRSYHMNIINMTVSIIIHRKLCSPPVRLIVVVLKTMIILCYIFFRTDKHEVVYSDFSWLEQRGQLLVWLWHSACMQDLQWTEKLARCWSILQFGIRPSGFNSFHNRRPWYHCKQCIGKPYEK